MQITDFVANLRHGVAVLSLPWAIERVLGRFLSPPAAGL